MTKNREKTGLLEQKLLAEDTPHILDLEAIQNVTDPHWLMFQTVLDEGFDIRDPAPRLMRILEELAEEGDRKALLFVANVRYFKGDLGFASALHLAFDGAKVEEFSAFELLQLKTLLELAVAKGDLGLVRDADLVRRFDDMSTDEILQELIDEQSHLHLRSEVLSALFARLLGDSA